MNELDAFCMPSRWEGYCVAVAEAMSLTTACILSDIDAFRELYADAALYHPVGEYDQLATQINNVVSNRNRMSRLSRRSFDIVNSNFELRNIVNQYESLYRSILK